MGHQKSLLGRLFALRGTLSSRQAQACFILGTLFVLVFWQGVTMTKWISTGIFPSPYKIILAYPVLHFQDALVRNLGYSYGLNALGTIEAVIFAIPIGFAIGLVPMLRAVFLRYIIAVRFLPLSALVGIFIAMFGIEGLMKTEFLAFSIFIYLLPTVIARIDEVEQVYVDTAYTIGASRWRTIRKVFIPVVMSRVFDDIKNLAALSWTYIIIAEMVNANSGGVGAMIFKASRVSRIDKAFAILIVIILVGLVQDKVLEAFGKAVFPFKQGGVA